MRHVRDMTCLYVDMIKLSKPSMCRDYLPFCHYIKTWKHMDFVRGRVEFKLEMFESSFGGKPHSIQLSLKVYCTQRIYRLDTCKVLYFLRPHFDREIYLATKSKRKIQSLNLKLRQTAELWAKSETLKRFHAVFFFYHCVQKLISHI